MLSVAVVAVAAPPALSGDVIGVPSAVVGGVVTTVPGGPDGMTASPSPVSISVSGVELNDEGVSSWTICSGFESPLSCSPPASSYC